MDAYVHITSPIRRLPDILNMLKIQEILGLWTPSSQASAFYEKWILRVDDLNAQMKAIRNVQTECNILHMCSSQPELLEQLHNGYAYHKKTRDDEMLPFQYNVYLPELNICLKIYSAEDLPEYSFGKYKLYVFDNEEKMKKKIRIQKKDL
jgi:exoribonuclease R